MSLAPHMELKSEVLPIQRRDFYVADTSLLNPLATNPIYDGEWLQLDDTYKLERGTGTQAEPAWQIWAERGRYDTQAIGKLPTLFIGGYEAETDICDVTGCAVGSPLVVAGVTVDGQTKRGLDLISAATGIYLVFAYVTRLVGTTKLRYWVNPGWKSVA
jgi:uncharacterized membrane protein (UPF0136 family)